MVGIAMWPADEESVRYHLQCLMSSTRHPHVHVHTPVGPKAQSVAAVTSLSSSLWTSTTAAVEGESSEREEEAMRWRLRWEVEAGRVETPRLEVDTAISEYRHSKYGTTLPGNSHIFVCVCAILWWQPKRIEQNLVCHCRPNLMASGDVCNFLYRLTYSLNASVTSTWFFQLYGL